MVKRSCTDCFHSDVCYAMGIWTERAETCTKYYATADVVEVRHGKWKEMAEYEHGGIKKLFFECPLCGRIEYQKEPYCHCGAKMDKGVN